MKHNQSGAVLAISLVLLTAITVLSLTGLQRSSLQTKIVANIQHQENVFNAAFNEQEFWFFEYARNPKENVLTLINAKDTSGQPAPVVLRDTAQTQPNANVQVRSSAIYIEPGSNNIAFAVGEETGLHRNYTFQLNTLSNVRNNTTLNSDQRSEFTFPGLSFSKNSL